MYLKHPKCHLVSCPFNLNVMKLGFLNDPMGKVQASQCSVFTNKAVGKDSLMHMYVKIKPCKISDNIPE